MKLDEGAGTDPRRCLESAQSNILKAPQAAYPPSGERCVDAWALMPPPRPAEIGSSSTRRPYGGLNYISTMRESLPGSITGTGPVKPGQVTPARALRRYRGVSCMSC